MDAVGVVGVLSRIDGIVFNFDTLTLSLYLAPGGARRAEVIFELCSKKCTWSKKCTLREAFLTRDISRVLGRFFEVFTFSCSLFYLKLVAKNGG